MVNEERMKKRMVRLSSVRDEKPIPLRAHRSSRGLPRSDIF